MFTEFRNAFELHCKCKCKQQTMEVIKLCLSCVLLFLIDFQTDVLRNPNTLFLYSGIKVHPVWPKCGHAIGLSLDELLMSLRTVFPGAL